MLAHCVTFFLLIRCNNSIIQWIYIVKGFVVKNIALY
nr:MAG TPA: hypothetical protein [Caudoviricetes sp.]